MTAIDDRTAQMALEDSPSIADIVKSPREFTRETLAGVVTALALIPEVISFSFVSGVDPKVALISSIVLGLVMSAVGGRPGGRRGRPERPAGRRRADGVRPERRRWLTGYPPTDALAGAAAPAGLEVVAWQAVTSLCSASRRAAQ